MRSEGGGVTIQSGAEDYCGVSRSDCFLFFISMGSHWNGGVGCVVGIVSKRMYINAPGSLGVYLSYCSNR